MYSSRKLILSLLLVFCGVGRGEAAEYQGYVSSIMAVGGKVFVVLNGGSGSGLCSAVTRFYLDPGSAYDRAMMALAMTAKTAESLVYVGGTDTCMSAWPYNDSQQLTAINGM